MSAPPTWLDQADLIDLHHFVLERTGGARGIREPGLLDSAMVRAANRYFYEGVEDIPALAAAYCVGIVKNHPFVDGNKRAAFLAMGLFLELNGLWLTASDDDATATMVAVASSLMDEPTLAVWIRANSAAI